MDTGTGETNSNSSFNQYSGIIYHPPPPNYPPSNPHPSQPPQTSGGFVSTMSPETKLRYQQLLDMPSIQSNFPITFRNKATWTNFDGYCGNCITILHKDAIRGSLTMPTPNVAIVEALGYCPKCKILTRFEYRLYDDMRITGIRDGSWVVWKAKPTSWGALFSKVKNLLQHLLQHLLR